MDQNHSQTGTKQRIAILGATGYTASELIRLLLRHPGAAVTVLTTRQDTRPHLSEVHRSLAGRLDLVLEDVSIEEVAERADCVFSCLPHAASAPYVKQLLELGRRVVDFSADYRLNDTLSYETWYGGTHPDPARVGNVAYGLPELFRESIVDANVVANPGCFPTSAILGLAPLIDSKLIDPESILVDAKTGVSGAGRNPKAALHFPECNESVTPYGVGTHRHMPEIDQILSRAFDDSVSVVFIPHLVSMDRGILSTIYAQPLRSIDHADLIALFQSFFKDEPFVRVVETPPSTKQVTGTNFCDVCVSFVRGTIVVHSAIDNLIKGASGAAVQNFNLMYGFDEQTALL